MTYFTPLWHLLYRLFQIGLGLIIILFCMFLILALGFIKGGFTIGFLCLLYLIGENNINDLHNLLTSWINQYVWTTILIGVITIGYAWLLKR